MEKKTERIEPLGLTLSKAKPLLKTLRHHPLAQQVTAFLATHPSWEACGAPLRRKGQRPSHRLSRYLV